MTWFRRTSADVARVMFRIILIVGILSSSTLAHSALGGELRTWSDNSGKHHIVARFSDIAYGVVHLTLEDGTLKRVRLENLNEKGLKAAFQHYAEKHKGRPLYGQATDLRSLNVLVRGDIQPDDNVVVALWNAIGCEEVGSSIRKLYMKELGLPMDPEPEATFLLWHTPGKPQGSQTDFRDGKSHRSSAKAAATAAWLTNNQPTFDLILKASKKSEYFSPMVCESSDRGMMDAIIPTAALARGVLRGLIAQCQHQLAQGEAEKAWETILAAYRISRLFSREPTIVGYYLGVACERMVCQSVVELATHDSFNQQLALRCLTDLQNLPALPAAADKLAIGEKAIAIDMLRRIGEGGPAQFHYTVTQIHKYHEEIESPEFSRDAPQPPPFVKRWSQGSKEQWDRAIPLVADSYDRTVDDLRISDPFQRELKIKARMADIPVLGQRNRMWKYYDPDRRKDVTNVALKIYWKGILPNDVLADDIAMFMNWLSFPDVSVVLQQENATRIRAGMLPSVVALGAYRSRHRRYPDTLAELDRRLLPDAPVDPVFGSSLVYRLQGDGYLLYSLGPDGKDDRGNEDLSAATYDIAISVKPE